MHSGLCATERHRRRPLLRYPADEIERRFRLRPSRSRWADRMSDGRRADSSQHEPHERAGERLGAGRRLLLAHPSSRPPRRSSRRRAPRPAAALRECGRVAAHVGHHDRYRHRRCRRRRRSADPPRCRPPRCRSRGRPRPSPPRRPAAAAPARRAASGSGRIQLGIARRELGAHARRDLAELHLAAHAVVTATVSSGPRIVPGAGAASPPPRCSRRRNEPRRYLQR